MPIIGAAGRVSSEEPAATLLAWEALFRFLRLDDPQEQAVWMRLGDLVNATRRYELSRKMAVERREAAKSHPPRP